ncbi:MAG TPA: plastocyanin/azurin family copper-binding protein [bacterium]|nr:plastocyanin/azurin family copper-binding protein [bacterium]
MLRLLHRLLLFGLGCALAIGSLSLPGRAQPAPRTWKVSIGADTPDHALQGQDFYPRTITVNAGDTITWTKSTVLEHTVTFLSGAKRPALLVPQPDNRVLFNPAAAFPQGGKAYDGTGIVSSGVLEPAGAHYTVTFTTPGRYTYVCLLHPGMQGTVVVQLAGAKLPMTQVGYGRAAAAQWAEALKAGGRLRAAWNVSTAAAPSGTVYTAPMVGDSQARITLLRFTPGPLRVKAGSTVRWVMKDPFEIHTVTFQGTGAVPQFLLLEQQAQGPPKIFFNPKILAPAGGPRHTGNTYHNSQILLPVNPPGPTEYSLTFSKPGTYTYWCVVHVPEGMSGTVIVQ